MARTVTSAVHVQLSGWKRDSQPKSLEILMVGEGADEMIFGRAAHFSSYNSRLAGYSRGRRKNQ